MNALSFRSRRQISLVATLAALLIVVAVAWHQENRLAHASYFTGSTVLASVVILSLIGVRRRLPVLPLGSVSTWTQIHIYVGIFSAGVYAMHVPTLIAGGVFECGLSIIFLLVTASGFYGIHASRTLPKRLTAVEGRLGRANRHRGQIAANARELLDGLSEQTAVRVLGSFYSRHLDPFFSGRPSLAYVLVPNGTRRRRLLHGLKELDRHLESEGRGTAGRLAALIRRRDDLDYQYALQMRLRLWLVIHGVLSLALLAGGVVHAAMVLRLTGEWF